MTRTSLSALSYRASLQRTRRRRIAGAAAAAILAAAVAVPTLWAHAVVFPKTSTLGAYERYVLRVPNEKAVATTRVEIHFPAGLRVTSFADVPGWQLETVTDSARNIIAAIWTGTLGSARFVELPFIAVNPRENARLVWPVFQTYADGEKVEWTGPEEGERPASSTVIEAQPAGQPTAAPGGGLALYLALGALILGLISLGVALRPASRAAGRPA